jgi:hypothetical protein
MLYINTPPMMIEPATASIAVYLLVKTPKTLIKNHNRIIKRPYHYKRKICNWIVRNHHTISDTIMDETYDYILDILNIIKIMNYNPSIFVIIYIIALIMVIIF